MSDDVERLCEVMHDAYETAAVASGWATQERSRVPWTDVPEANKITMRAAVQALLDAHEQTCPAYAALERVEQLCARWDALAKGEHPTTRAIREAARIP